MEILEAVGYGTVEYTDRCIPYLVQPCQYKDIYHATKDCKDHRKVGHDV